MDGRQENAFQVQRQSERHNELHELSQVDTTHC